MVRCCIGYFGTWGSCGLFYDYLIRKYERGECNESVGE